MHEDAGFRFEVDHDPHSGQVFIRLTAKDETDEHSLVLAFSTSEVVSLTRQLIDALKANADR